MTTMLAVGLMSGTSLDGIDAALIETDGEGEVRVLASRGAQYDAGTRSLLAEATREALTLDRPEPTPLVAEAERVLTDLHADAARAVLLLGGVEPAQVGVVGFHGQTIAHRPERGWTWQIGDGARLARMLGVAVVNDLRSADVAAGGQGAPLLPVYHRALTAAVAPPLAVLNLGGVANITFVSSDGALIAFDCGPANGLIDSWVEAEAGLRFDADGALAAGGQVHADILDTLLDRDWFDAPPPKSLDRHDFTTQPVRGLSLPDGAATLTRFTAEAVALGLHLLPERPIRLIVAGGGRRNPTLMAMIGDACGVAPEPIEVLGHDGDATEAEGFAYMAVRTLRGLPISFPGTTGVPSPTVGGVVHRP